MEGRGRQSELSDNPGPGLLDMRNRQDEKIIIDDTQMDMQENPLELSHQVNTSRALDRSGGKTPDRDRSRVFNDNDISMEYMGKIDDIEMQNRTLRKQIEKIELGKEAEVEK